MYGIVVGIDSSRTAEHALAWAAKEAIHRALPLTVVTVCSVPGQVAPGEVYYAPATDEELESARAEAIKMVDKVLAAHDHPAALRYQVHVEYGNVADILLRYATEADQLVVGSRGVGGFRRLLLGSVSTAVVHHAPCPVTVVPTGRPAHESA